MEKQQIKHIFSDLDHTLWDFKTNSTKIFKNNNITVSTSVFLN